ncbi:hypothetical protein HHI36_000590 [Cryptolaemus montrouzieri]|uniref:Uncharacterized protein n=1 Tax=Cryptolaemus montrouzieri TaxID=559131 RepID=A0ABD2P5U5_9CUCU
MSVQQPTCGQLRDVVLWVSLFIGYMMISQDDQRLLHVGELPAHDFHNIAENLENIHLKYGLNEKKIFSTVTDNASNLVEAFKEFYSITEAENEQNVDQNLQIQSATDFQDISSMNDNLSLKVMNSNMKLQT